MSRHRIIVTTIVLACSLVPLSLGVRAGLPDEASEPPERLPISGKSVQQAPGTRITQRVSLRPLDVETFDCLADTCILEGRPDTNLGSAFDMWVGYDESLDPYPKTARSFVFFDTSTIPPEATIVSAELWLYLVSSWDYPLTSRTITTYRVPSSWSEETLTWNNAPKPGEEYGSTEIEHGEWDWYSFDVTDLVRAWHDGTYENHGIMIRGPEVSGYDSSRRGFYTREGEDPPELDVDFETATATPTQTETPKPSPTPTQTQTPEPTPTATQIVWHRVLLPLLLKNARMQQPTPTPTATLSPTLAATPSPTPSATLSPTPCPHRPKAGRWEGDGASFTVTSSRDRVRDFELQFNTSICGSWSVSADDLPVVNCRFGFESSQGASIWGHGTFVSNSELEGRVTVFTGASMCFEAWSASWVSASAAE
jgi:hypothetical protein